jgi:hypothetical protein
MMSRRFLIALIASTTAVPLQADNNRQEWLTLTGDVKIDYNDSVNATVILRSKPDSFDAGQRILRASIIHRLEYGKSLSLAYTHVRGFVSSGPDTTQHRISQSFALPLGNIADGKIDGRMQAEEAFTESYDDIGIRLRPRVRWVRPLSKKADVELQLSDEVILSLNDTDYGQKSGFTANRATAAVRFGLGKHFGIAPGYTWQLVNRSNGPNRNDHVLGLTVDAHF